LTRSTVKYIEGGRAPETGSLVFISGSFWMLPETDGSIEADTFEVVTEDASLALNLPPPSVNAIGTVASVIGRDVFMDVGAYSREVCMLNIGYFNFLIHLNGRPSKRWTIRLLLLCPMTAAGPE
jgi:hypothetical protein